MTVFHPLAFVLGAALAVVILVDAFQVMLLPRKVRWRLRPVRAYFSQTWMLWTSVMRIVPKPVRSGYLSIYGPLSVLTLFGIWSFGLIGSFGLLHWSIQPGPDASLGEQFYFSGVTFFTLGYGDITPETGPGRALAVLEAGLGFAFIAVVIGYLPTLYQLYSTRESHVLRLDARAGSPPTAAELLLRHAASQAEDDLRELLQLWEGWSAQLLESHVSYPMLSYYRSQHDNMSWLGALTVVMDASAFTLVSFGGRSQLQARMSYTAGRLALLELASILEVEHARVTEDRLPAAELERLRDRLEGYGLSPRRDAEADRELFELRRAYEPLLAELSRHLRLSLPDWTPRGEAPDNWEADDAGRRAKTAVEDAVEREAAETAAETQIEAASSPAGGVR